MMYTLHSDSPLGGILLAADDVGLTGLWFDGEPYFAEGLDPDHTAQKTPILQQAERWLEVYFSGREPGFTPPLHPMGQLLCQRAVGALAKQLAEKQGRPRMSAQAVGGAVGHNRIAILIPCHRVVGTNGSLTGYAGGIDKKEKLLRMEHVNMEQFFVP